MQNILITIRHWRSVHRIRKAIIMAHSIKPSGRIAGHIDECENGRIRGWIYDARRPHVPLTLDVCVNGSPVERIIANIYRPDLAELLKDNGLHGFEGVVTSPKMLGTVTVRVADKPEYTLGPIEVEGAERTSEKVNGVSLISEAEIAHRLRHIFDHITATHEHGLRRFDKLEVVLDLIRSAQNGALCGSGVSHGNFLLYDAPSSGISGIGQFVSDNPPSDEVEEALIQARFEHALIEARCRID